MAHRLLTCRLFTFLTILLLLNACAPETQIPEDGIVPTFVPVPSTATPLDDLFSNIPPQARIATHPGDPRPVVYWALWNSCAPENRATQAAANGGREAGWVLMDDLLLDPGIQLGNYTVATCEAGLALLQKPTDTGDESDDPIYDLASALLAAELNLNAGAESCSIAEEVVRGGHMILSDVGFNGKGEYGAFTSREIANAIPRLVELLSSYNTGTLCQ